MIDKLKKKYKKWQRRRKAIKLFNSLPDLFENDSTGGIRPFDYEEQMKKWEESRKKREAIMSKYPLLYGDRNKPMTQTAMCWGLDVNDGWLPLIERLSAKLEKEIEQFLKDNPNIQCECGHTKEQHLVFDPMKWSDGKNDILGCSHVFKMSLYKGRNIHSYMVPKNPIKKFFLTIYKRVSWKLQSLVSRSFWWLAENTPLHKKTKCYCKGYTPYHPKASQVKEKFGGLRFYMNATSEVMDKMISEAEREASKTCESCGEPGELCSDFGWYASLCKTCMDKRNKEDGREYQTISDMSQKEDEES